MVLSLASNTSCLLVDDELNILPTSSHVRNIEPLPVDGEGSVDTNRQETDLKGLSDSLADTLVRLNSWLCQCPMNSTSRCMWAKAMPWLKVGGSTQTGFHLSHSSTLKGCGQVSSTSSSIKPVK